MLARSILVLFLGVAFAWAQGVDATLTGSVTDPSGASVAGCRIAVRNQDTGVTRSTTSNEAGVYLFAALPPGTYRLTAEKAGFHTVVVEEVTLEVGGRLGVNIKLEVGAVTETVEVRAAAENQLGYETASAGGMLTGQQIQELPLPARSSLSLTYTQAGLYEDNVAGSRIGALNIALDGVNIQDQRLNQGISSPIFQSVDKIEEFRIVVAPADAELGRGIAHIQMASRSGTNRLRGSLFESHRNTVLNANTWFNNQRGHDAVTGAQISPRDVLIRNQYGGRLGGPIRRNKTFYHVLIEGWRERRKNAVTNTVYTATARQGIYRFFPGVRNANAQAAVPTVDLTGNPVAPPEATGPLQSVSLYGRDSNRRGPDPTGTIQRLLGLTPLPNNFRTGDGLNFAGYTWQRPSALNMDQGNIKIDHHLSPLHRLSVSYTHENRANFNAFSESTFPDTPAGQTTYRNRFGAINVWSNLKPSVLNEFRFGFLRNWLRWYTGWEVGDSRTRLLPNAGGYPYVPVFGLVTDPINQADNPVGRISPLYQFTDNVTWIRGRHSFKSGFEVRFTSTNGFNSADVMPRVNLGTGGASVGGLSSIPGIGTNLTNAITMLNDLSGSVSSVVQALNATGGRDPQWVPGEVKQRTWKRKEFGVFFKDDFKVRPNLTLNLGVRWDFYGVPYDRNGRTATLVGGSSSLFGISGRSFADLYQPGRMVGELTRIELVGPNSPNPSRKLHNNDWNNFAPAVGFSWRLPWFQTTTVFRAGYMIGYERDALRLTDAISGDAPGLRQRVVYTSASFLSMEGVRLPLTPAGKPFDLIPLTDRSQTVRVFDDNLRSPYVQNWNASLERQITRNTTLSVRYVASKGTKLIRTFDINETVIFENGILEAFRMTQEGGNAPLFDRIFMGLNISGLGVVDGRNVTGSDVLRSNSTTQTYLAHQRVAAVADWLNTTTTYTNQRGGLLRRAGLPENFVTGNPQFASARLTSNVANSTYHSLQVEAIKRFTRAWSWRGNYTWSKALGEEEGSGEEMIDSYRDNRNRRLDRRLLDFHRTHIIRNSGTFEFPFGPGRKWINGGGALARIVERWQIGFIFNLFSGAPVYVTSGTNRDTWNTFGDNTPTAVAPFAKSTGEVKKTPNGVIYFEGLKQVPDPSIQNLTTKGNVRSRSTLQAIADQNGAILLVNPVAGTNGNLAPNFLEGPGDFRFDVNLIKRIAAGEGRYIELRFDAIDMTNSPHFGNPNADMNSVNFGRITSATGNRILVAGLRFSF